MPRTHNPTFGFECEFDQGAEAMCSSLYSAGYTRTDELHSWHCDCEECEFEHPDYNDDIPRDKTFRFQRDSSCSGELITRIYRNLDEAIPNMQLIQQHADQNDAIPGWSAGFHVHVSINGVMPKDLGLAFAQYLRFEPMFEMLAAGRFNAKRDNNHPVGSLVTGWFYDMYASDPEMIPLSTRRRSEYMQLVRNVIPKMSEMDKMMLQDFHYTNDRHSNLSVKSRHGTWEFRLWNSTRVAWRMEMFVRLSRAILNPALYTSLVDVELETNVARWDYLGDHEVVAFLPHLDAVDSRAAELVERQYQYAVKYRNLEIPELITG